MEEIWKDIAGYEGYYQASSLGKIRSVEHYSYSRHRISKNRVFKGKVLNPDIITGKTRYALYDSNGGRKWYMGHILIAKTFPEICGEWFEGCQVHHKDCNPLNNKPENLICLSPEEHKRIHRELGKYDGKNNPFYGKHHSEKALIKNRRRHRKPIIQLDLDGNEIMGWLSCTDCERQTGMDKASINRCCLGKQHSAHGYKWRYAL